LPGPSDSEPPSSIDHATEDDPVSRRLTWLAAGLGVVGVALVIGLLIFR